MNWINVVLVITIIIGTLLFLSCKSKHNLHTSITSNTGYEKNSAIAQIYELLFCDMTIDQLYSSIIKNGNKAPEGISIVKTLLDSNKNEEANQQLDNLLEDKNLDTRTKLVCWNQKRQLKVSLPAGSDKKVLGVIIENHMDQGLDVIAAYADGTARYLNYSGAMIIWETFDEEMNNKIQNIFKSSEVIAQNAGLWDKKRLPPPVKGNLRISLLTPAGLIFGEGKSADIMNDPVANEVINSGINLMLALMKKAKQK